VALVALAVGLWLGGHPTIVPKPLRDAFVDKQTRDVAEAFDDIHDLYYRPLSKSAIANAAIRGVVQSLDDQFSAYYTPKEYRDFQQGENSEFSGIGVDVQKDPLGLAVRGVRPRSPARDAGIRAGDVITMAAGKSLKGLSVEASSRLIKGPEGTDVRIGFRDKKGVTHVKTLTRKTFAIPQTASRLRKVDGQRVGIVRLGQFGTGSHGEVAASLRRLMRRGAKRFVFDLRGNGGGLVTEAQLIASLFLKPGLKVVTTKGRSVPTRTLHSIGRPLLPSAPLVVLVDHDSASASEIVTGALQDNHRARVVGTHTFGKGIFQQVVELSDGGALKLTAGQYFTPDGHNLGGRGVAQGKDIAQGAGITPDTEAVDNPKTKRDEALDVALRTVVGLKPGT
jgi:carboxyl-terminal processing protease